MTGRLTVKEEVSLKGFSQKGIRVYKLVYSVINIVAGLLIIGLGVERLLVAQNILEDNFTIKLIALGIAVVLVVVYIIVRAQCKKMSDDE